MADKSHWERVYTTKAVDSVSWFQEHAELSLQLIQKNLHNKNAAIIDVGGGASTLVDDLLATNYQDLTVLDLSSAALDTAQQRLGARAQNVRWLAADITQVDLPAQSVDLWHDRAVFHFLTEDSARAAYKTRLLTALKPKGLMLIATFAENGPTQCSNLPVMRYSAEQLYAEFQNEFILLETHTEIHHTPFATTQNFIYCLMQRK